MPKGKFSFKGNSAAAKAYAPGQVRKAADVPAKAAPAVRAARVGADGVAGVGVRRGPGAAVPGRGPVEMQAGAARSFAPGAGAAMAAKAAERRAAGPAASVQPKKPVESAVGPAVQPRRNSSPFGGRKKK